MVSYREYKRKKVFLDILEEYGITEEDLKMIIPLLKSLKCDVDKLKNNNPYELSAAQEKKIEDEYKNKSTPEDVIKQFTEGLEEFYPHGKRE